MISKDFVLHPANAFDGQNPTQHPRHPSPGWLLWFTVAFNLKVKLSMKSKRCFWLGKSGKSMENIKPLGNLCWEEHIANKIAKQLAWNTQNRSLVDDFPLPKKWFSDFIVVFRRATLLALASFKNLSFPGLRCKCLTTQNPGSTKAASTQKLMQNCLSWICWSYHFSGISFDDQKQKSSVCIQLAMLVYDITIVCQSWILNQW